MWKSRLFWKLFLGYGLLYVALSAVFVIREGQRHERMLLPRWKAGWGARRRSSRRSLQWDLPAPDLLQARLRTLEGHTGLRYTVIDSQGKVLADSRYPSEGDEQSSGATGADFGPAIRERFGNAGQRNGRRRVQYLARSAIGPNRERLFVRAAVNMTTIRKDLWETQRFVWLTVLAAGLIAAPLSYVIVRRIVTPLTQLTEMAKAIAAGDLAQSIVVQQRDELGQLASAFRRMQEELSQRIRQLQQYGERFATVLGGMVEGVLAVDVDNRVILANDACKSMLGLSQEVVGRPLLEVIPNVEIQQAVTQAMAEEGPCEREISLSGTPRRSLHILATRLRGKPPAGAVVVLHDVTELRRLENIRRDFVANVSHELKTPLASITAYCIAGYSKMICYTFRGTGKQALRQINEFVAPVLSDLLKAAGKTTKHVFFETDPVFEMRLTDWGCQAKDVAADKIGQVLDFIHQRGAFQFRDEVPSSAVVE